MNASEYQRILIQNPFGWSVDDPPTFSSFSFERIDPYSWINWHNENWKLSYYAGVIYVSSIFAIQRFMRNRPAFELKGPLFLWNLSLGIFSIAGFVRATPELLHVLSQPGGFYRSLCVKDGINAPTLFWGIMFGLSKFWELGDTIFIVLRKRPLVFLQWYHHLVTLWVVWTTAALLEPIVRWYIVLNYGVHSLMYPYFALKTVGVKIPSKVAYTITTLQLAQMLAGFGVNMTSLYLLRTGSDCARYPSSIRAFTLVYGSFIILFGKLFHDSVILSKGKTLGEKSLKQK